MATINTKIQLRTDLKTNWEQKNPILKLGEIAIVCFDNDYKDIKIGNGISSFNELSYLYQNEIKTDKITGKDLHVKSIAQGYNVKATPTSLATGIFSYANGNFNVVHGIEAKAKDGDDYAFVFNGTNLQLDGENFYESHGEGSFNVNPLSGLSGFYIGEQHLASILNNYLLSNEISDYYKKSETSSAIEISTTIFEISDYIDGFEKAVYGEDKNRLLLEIPYVDPTTVTDTQKAVAYLNNVLQLNGIDFRIDEDYGTYEDVIEATQRLYELAGEECPNLKDYQDVVDAINHISTEDPPVFAANGQMLFGGSAGTNISIKEFILKLNKKLGQTSSKVTSLSNEVAVRSDILSTYTDTKSEQVRTELTSLVNTTKNQLTAQIATKQTKITANGFLSCSGNGNVVAAEISPRTLPFMPLSGNMILSGGMSISGNVCISGETEFKQHVKFNSADGLSSIEIGDTDLCAIIKDAGGKVHFRTIENQTGRDVLSILHVTALEYAQKLKEGNILSNELYIVSCDTMTFMNKRGTDVAEPIMANDAATKGYVDNIAEQINVSSIYNSEHKIDADGNVYVLQDGNWVKNDVLALSSSLSDYYQKTETSSAVQIKNAFDNKIQFAEDDNGMFNHTDLSVWKLSEDKYIDLVGSGQIISNCIYIISSDTENMYGKRVTNVADPVELSDAVNKLYVDNSIDLKSKVTLRTWKD